MSDFDSSLEAQRLADLFRPRNTSDSNGRAAGKTWGAGGRGGNSSIRGRLARVVGRTPEVMVKVTGRKQGVKELSAHLDYIGRKGDVPLEARDGDVLAENHDRADVARHWSDPAYQQGRAKVAAVSMVFSMPAGTDPDTVLAAVREVARSEIAPEWDYAMALHTDTPRPHVHLTVSGRGDTGRRFNPRPHTLHRYRERFAEELRARGVAAEATPRKARGVGRAGQSMALYRMRERLRGGTAMQPCANQKFRAAVIADYGRKAPQPAFVKRSRVAWVKASHLYLAAADRLAHGPDPADRQLAGEVRDFVKRGRVPTAHEQGIAAVERTVAREGQAKEHERRRGASDRSR